MQLTPYEKMLNEMARNPDQTVFWMKGSLANMELSHLLDRLDVGIPPQPSKFVTRYDEEADQTMILLRR